jgi:hypothetical protein
MFDPAQARIKMNIESMIVQGATEDEIETYVSSEGTTAYQLAGRVFNTAPAVPKQHAEVDRIKANMRSMRSQRATEADLDEYAEALGITPEDLGGSPRASAPTAPPLRPHNEVLQEMIGSQRPLNEISDFLTSIGDDPSQHMDAIKADMDFRAANPDYKGPRGNINLPKAPPTAREAPSLNDGINASFLEGLIPNLSKNVRGVGGVLGNGLRTVFNGDYWAPREAFQRQYDAATEDDKAFEEAYPNIDNLSAMTGFGAGFALPVTKLAPRASPLKSAALNGAATGALYGGLTGALNPTGAGRAENAAWGAIGSAGLGTVLSQAPKAISATGSFARRNIPGFDAALLPVANVFNRALKRSPSASAPVQQARRIVGKDIADSASGTPSRRMTPAAVSQEVANRSDMGMPAMPADLSAELRSRTAWALKGNGPMATAARTRLADRQANQGLRVRQSIQEELGSAVDPIAAAQAISRKASAEAAPNYRQAYAEGIVITPEIQQHLDTPAVQNNLAQARNNILNRGGSPDEMGLIVDSAGNVSMGQSPTLEAMDNVISTVRGDTPRDAFGNPIKSRSISAEQAAVGNLDALLRQQNKAYDTAKATFADDMAIRDAMARGADISKMTGHEINANVRNTPTHAQEAWMTGAGTALSDKASTGGQNSGTNVAQAIRKDLGLPYEGLKKASGDTVKIDAIEAMSGKPGMLSRLDDKLGMEDEGYQTFSSAYRAFGSPEKSRSPIGPMDALQAAGSLAGGHVVSALASVLLRGNPNGTARFKRDVQESIAEILTKSNSQEVQQAMELIGQQAATDAQFAAALNSVGVQVSRLGALTFGGANGDPYAPTE